MKKITLAKFSNLKLAQSFSHRTIKMSAIMLGDDNRFWVVTMATFERLIKANYTAIK